MTWWRRAQSSPSRNALGALSSLLLLAGTACKEAPEPPVPTEPWPAAPPPRKDLPSDDVRTRVTYRIQPESIVQVSLPAKDANPSGTFSEVRGQLELDLVDIRQSRGVVEVDLTSVVMENEHPAGEYTKQARNWMNLGASRLPEDVERSRFARFVIRAIDHASHQAPHLGKRLSRQDSNDEVAELRQVTLTLSGDLEVNGLRAARKASARLDFHYPASATAGLQPTKVEIASLRPLLVALGEYEIQPRDEHGRLASADLELLGRLVGRTARINFRLLALR